MFKAFKNNKLVSIYEPVDLPLIKDEDLSLELNVKVKAQKKADNTKNIKMTAELDSNEISFKNHLSNLAIQAHTKVEDAIIRLKDSISSASIKDNVHEILNIEDEYKAQLSSEINPKIEVLKSARKVVNDRSSDVERFKNEAKTHRMPIYPESKVKFFGILILAFIGESVLNGNFLAAGSDYGLLGGFIEAFAISLVNIGAGFLAGLLFTFKNSVASYKKLFGFAIPLFLTIALYFFNLLVAHFREALPIHPETAYFEAILSFTNGVFQIDDFNSWVLFSIGIGFAILAMYKGYYFDDPIPGYGRIDRKRISAEDDFHIIKEEIEEGIDSIHEEYLSALERVYEYAKNTKSRLGNNSSAIQSQTQQLKAYKSTLEGALKSIITQYREELANQGEIEFASPSAGELSIETITSPIIEESSTMPDLSEDMKEIEAFYPKTKTKLAEEKSSLKNKVGAI